MPERPSELIYGLDERPPWPQLLALGFQHVAVICPYLVLVALVAEAAKLPHAAAQSAVGLAMIAVAFVTVLQSLRLGPVGSGYLCPPSCRPRPLILKNRHFLGLWAETWYRRPGP
jgi:xanthine permease XanP